MQNSTAETTSKLNRSPENAPQQPVASSAQFHRIYNPRFVVTPESMNLRSDTPALNEEQPFAMLPPLVDVKSYYERHNKSMVQILSDSAKDSTSSFQSSQSNAPTNSYASIRGENIDQHLANNPNRKTDFMTQRSLSNSSPPTSSQQWNFEQSVAREGPQENVKCPSGSALIQTLKSLGELSLTSDQPSIHANVKPHTHCTPLTSPSDTPMSGFEQHLHNFRSASDAFMDNSAKINFKSLNDIYAKRIEDIDADAWGDKDLKIFTYQEWIEILTRINESFINNMDELEKEVTMRLQLVQRSVNNNCRHSQGNELMKCRKDIDTLLKYIRNAHHHNKWDLQGLTFETISPAQLLDLGGYDGLTIDGNGGEEIKNFNEADIMQKNKLYTNMKALAHEVAEKHDEVRELKRQIICMEEEIQKAQKKIQLKDDVIKELRNDLKCANNKLSTNLSADTNSVMPPINFENQSSRSENTDHTASFSIDNNSQFDSLSHTELEEQHKIRTLGEEISKLLETQSDLTKHQMENQHKKVNEILEKLESEKAAANHKLDFIRRQLIDLESDSSDCSNDCDSGFDSKSESDQDAKLLDAVRKRLRKLNDLNCELNKRVQKLELENSEFFNNMESAKTFSRRNDDILRQIADLLCEMKGKFSYTEAYNTSSNKMNPFCEAIVEMQKDFQEKEAKLLNELRIKHKQQVELSQMLLENEKDFNEGRTMHLNYNNIEDVNNIPTTLLCTSSQLLPVTTISTGAVTSQAPSTLSTPLTGQPLDSTTVAYFQGDLEK